MIAVCYIQNYLCVSFVYKL